MSKTGGFASSPQQCRAGREQHHRGCRTGSENLGKTQ